MAMAATAKIRTAATTLGNRMAQALYNSRQNEQMRSIQLALLLVAISSAWTHAQTIADVARQERARRSTVQSKATIANDEETTVAKPVPVPESRPIVVGQPTVSEVHP